MTTSTPKRRKQRERTYYIGLVGGRPHQYRHHTYYDGVLHGDFFTSRRAAKKCYEHIQEIRIIFSPTKKKR